jgi:glutamate-1-semialdehyde 2,1-aminomutase
VANGYPLGVIGGKKEIMQLFCDPDPAKRVLIAGTYNAHPVNTAASIATIEILQNPDVYRQIGSMSDMLYSGLEELFREKGIQAVIARNASAFCAYFAGHCPVDLHDLLENVNFELDRKYRQALIRNKIYHIPIACKQGSVSYAHTEDDIHLTLEATREALKSI